MSDDLRQQATSAAISGSDEEKEIEQRDSDVKETLLMHPCSLYEFHSRLGQGTYGSVFRATNKRTRQEVAIKILPMTGADTEVDNYEKEVAFLSNSIGCKYIVQLLETYRFENEVWIVMEHCDAGTLDSILLSRECGPMDEITTASIMKMLLLGLNHLHENKKIHRDIKGANILVNSRGECKIADFGLSKLLECTGSAATSLCGTPFFVAPEICLRRPYNSQVDIWSLGILAYVLLTGNVPRFLRHLKPIEVMQLIPATEPERWMLPSKVQHRPGQQPFPRGTGWSPELNDFMRCCLEPNPEQRWTAMQLLTHPYIMRVPRYVSDEVPLVLCASAYAVASNNLTHRPNIPGVNPEYYCRDEYEDDGAGAAMMFARIVERCMESIQSKSAKAEMTAEEKKYIRYAPKRGILLEIGMNFDEIFAGEELPREIRVNAPVPDDIPPQPSREVHVDDGRMAVPTPSTPITAPTHAPNSPPTVPMMASPAPSNASGGEMGIPPRAHPPQVPARVASQAGQVMPQDETCALAVPTGPKLNHGTDIGVGSATPPSRPTPSPPSTLESPGTPAQPGVGYGTPSYAHTQQHMMTGQGAAPTRLPFSVPSTAASNGRSALIGMGVGRPGLGSPARK